MQPLKEYFLLDPDVIFLNHGSFGATPRPVFEVYQDWQRRLERQPVLLLGREYDALLGDSRRELGHYLNAAEDELVYVPNATHGVNVVAHSLRLTAGDEVLTTDHEYGACDYTWDFYCKRSGAKYLHQPISLPAGAEQDVVEQFCAGITPRTKVVYLSHITSPTALRLPVEEICRRARKEGILTVVDAAHSPGQIPVDLRALGADVVTGNCHKWMMAAKGSAFLYVRRDMQHQIEPLVVGWGSNPTPETTTGSRYVDLLQWTGTKDPSAALTVPAAIQFMREHNWSEVRAECHELLRYTIGAICDLTKLPPPYPLESTYYSQMAVAPLPACNLAVLKTRSYEEYRIEVPLIQWQDRQFVRVSVQGYNTKEDVDALVAALGALLPQVAAP